MAVADTKYLELTAEQEYSDYDGDPVAAYVHFREVQKNDIIKDAGEFDLQYAGLIRVKKQPDGKFSPMAVSTLKKNGWVQVELAENIAQKKAMEQEFFLLEEKSDKSFLYNGPKFTKVELDQLTDYQIGLLAKGARIVQKVSLKSVLSEKDYNKYRNAVKKNEAAAAKKKESDKKKAEKQKQKEIEKAKKVLEEAKQDGLLK